MDARTARIVRPPLTEPIRPTISGAIRRHLAVDQPSRAGWGTLPTAPQTGFSAVS
jgi:hypothetical protein